jgi:prophage DNA circulation protein
VSWRDRFKSKGSFRGAEFVIQSDDLEFGRRVVKHEFPNRDDPSAEDLGKKAREHSVTVFVIGDDYQNKRDALIEAIEQPGPGAFVHPYFGTLNVTISSSRVRHSTGEGGFCRFTLSFFITPPEPALQEFDTQIAVELSVAESLAQSLDDFGNEFDMLGAANDLVQGVINDVDSVMSAVESVVTGVTSNITQLITAPFEMGAAILGAFNVVENALSDPIQALNVYRRLFNAGDDLAVVSTATPSRQQQADSIAATHRIVQQTAVASACLMASRVSYDSVDEAVSLRDELLAAIDEQINQQMTDSLFAAFMDMRSAMVKDLRTRGMLLPRIVSFTPGQTLPALVLAHRLYADATREAEIVARNNIYHPGFVPGGVALEVLTNV